MGEEENFGLSKGEAEKTGDYLPNVDLTALDESMKVDYKIIDKVPKIIKWKDRDTGEERESPVLTAYDMGSGIKVNLWLSAKSLKMGFFALKKKYGSLKDLVVRITVMYYKHEKYGKTRGYNVQVIDENEAQ